MNDDPPSGAPDASGLELDRPAGRPVAPQRPQGSSASNPALRPAGSSASNPSMRPVQSAMRSEPLPGQAPKAARKDRLKEGAVDTLLNSVSILGDLADDFRSADKYLKYKLLVLATWLFLTTSSFLVACPGGGPANDIDAYLVKTGEVSRPIYAVKNNSLDAWKDVAIVVNGQYRTTQAEVEANGSVTLSAAVLFDAKGKKAPKELVISTIEVHVIEPEATVVLLQGGQPQ